VDGNRAGYCGSPAVECHPELAYLLTNSQALSSPAGYYRRSVLVSGTPGYPFASLIRPRQKHGALMFKIDSPTSAQILHRLDDLIGSSVFSLYRRRHRRTAIVRFSSITGPGRSCFPEAQNCRTVRYYADEVSFIRVFIGEMGFCKSPCGVPPPVCKQEISPTVKQASVRLLSSLFGRHCGNPERLAISLSLSSTN
jgi:hypothetical protein